MAVTTEQRKAALDLLLPYQRADFEGIFRAMDGILLSTSGFRAKTHTHKAKYKWACLSIKCTFELINPLDILS